LEGKVKELVEQHAQDMEECDAAAERYNKSLPQAKGAVLKQKAKDDATQQKIAAKHQAEENKLKAKEYRVSLKKIGHQLNGGLQICKRRGMWQVPNVKWQAVGSRCPLVTLVAPRRSMRAKRNMRRRTVTIYQCQQSGHGWVRVHNRLRKMCPFKLKRLVALQSIC